MLKRFLFAYLTLCCFIFVPSNVSADNKIIRKKTVRNATITAGKRLSVFARGKTLNSKIMNGGIEDIFTGCQSFQWRAALARPPEKLTHSPQ